MPAAVAVLGVLLILIAIPFGLMLAPIAIGTVIVAVAVRRVGPAIASSSPSVVA
jgi:hypothetical protein